MKCNHRVAAVAEAGRRSFAPRFGLPSLVILGSFFRVDLGGEALAGARLRADLSVDLVRQLELVPGRMLPVLLPRRRPGTDRL